MNLDDKISAEMREKLYDEIWTEAMSKVAPRYGVSDVTLKKRCKLWDIPIPSREYRGKVAAGQSPERDPLPKLSSKAKRYVYGYAVTYIDLKTLPDAALYSEEPLFVFSEKTRDLIRKYRKINHISRSSDVIINSLKTRLEDMKKDKKCKNIEAYKRLFTIFSSLVSSLENLESYGSAWGNEFCVLVAGTIWTIDIIAPAAGSKPIAFHFRDDNFHSQNTTAKQFTFEDKDDVPLENQIGEIIYKQFVEAGRILQEKEINEREEKKKVEEAAYWRKLQPYIEAENAKVDQALKEVNDYKKAVSIREYAKAFYEKNSPYFDVKPELCHYHQWLMARADWVDPLIENDYDALLKANE